MISIDKILWTKVDSSQIKAISFDFKESALFVKFKNNDVWQYTPFSREEYKAFVSSKSLGSHFYSNIKSSKTAIKIGTLEN